MSKKKVSIFQKKTYHDAVSPNFHWGIFSDFVALLRYGGSFVHSTLSTTPHMKVELAGTADGEETQGTRDGYRATMIYPMLFDG